MVYSSACTFSFCFCTFCYYFCIFCFSTLGLFHTEGGCRENWRQGTPAAPPVAAYSPYSRVLSTTEYLFVLNLVSITLSNMCEHHSSVEKINYVHFKYIFSKREAAAAVCLITEEPPVYFPAPPFFQFPFSKLDFDKHFF